MGDDLLCSETFRFSTPASPGRVYDALTSADDQAGYLDGVTIDSSWATGASLVIRRRGGDPRHAVHGDVVAAHPPCRLSYSIDGGTGPDTYITWQIRPGCGGAVVTLTIDGPSPLDGHETEDTWLPILAALQSLLVAATQLGASSAADGNPAAE